MILFQAVPPVPPLPPEAVIVQGPMIPPWVTLPPQVTALIALGFFAACALVLYPLMRALGRRLEGGRSQADPALRSEIEELRARLGEMDAMQHRLVDLEERVDFAERLLAQRRDAERLPGG